jgi:hypothetical protein
MKLLRAAVILLAVLEAGWITFDGVRALKTGTYLKPRLGAYGGSVGEWTRVASVLGAPPGSTRAKRALIGYGLAWLGATFAFSRRAGWAWWMLFVFAAGALWYSSLAVPISLAQMLLLVAVRQDR